MNSAVTRSSAPPTDAADSHMGSEYMDARSYLKQPVRPRPVKPSDATFHGSNESEFLPEALDAK